ncbi:MAG: radical SAM protein [Myxococcales bacterium]|nr:radical SAM protein [Myxococcales bacterium]
MARASLALSLSELRRPQLADDCLPVCLRVPDAPPQSEIYGELPHFFRPHPLSPGLDGVPQVTLSLRPGLYSYKLKLPSGTWQLHAENPRTRSVEGLRNNVLSIGGCDEPILHVPVFPDVCAAPDGRLTIRAALRKSAGSSLTLRYRELDVERELAMDLVGDEDEHHLFAVKLPLSSSRVDYFFRLPSGKLVGGPSQSALRVTVPKSDLPSWWRDAVLYSVLVDRFRRGDGQPWPVLTDERARAGGDLDGVCAALPYLSDLGVTVLHLTPIWQSPSAHRYDAQNPLVVDPALGGEAALIRLLRESERVGIRILLDITLTHVNRDFLPFCDVRAHGFQSLFADWFHLERWPFSDGPSPGYQHYQHGQWQEPLLAVEHPDVATYLLSVLLHYAQLGVAGFRLDSAADVPTALLSLLRQGVRAVRKDALILGELTVDNIGHYVGRGLDCATELSLQRRLVEWLSGRQSALQLAKHAQRRAFVRGHHHAALGMTASHDLPRLRSLLDEQTAQLGHFVSLLRPEVPMIYYGDELGMYSDDPTRAFEDVWPDRMPLDWSQVSDENSTLTLFRSLLTLRQKFPSLRHGDCLELTATDQPELLIFRRQLGDEVLEVYAHARSDETSCLLRTDSPSDVVVLATLGQVAIDTATKRVALGPLSAVLLRRQPPPEVIQLSDELTKGAATHILQSYRLGITSGLLLPSKLYLTATERCNLRCQHCITSAPEKTATKTARTMQPWVLDALEDAMASASYFGFSHGGESLMSAQFFDILRRIRRARRGQPYDVHLLSNGMLLDEATVAALIELGVTSLAVSLDGATEETNDEIRTGCDLGRVWHNLKHATALRRKLRADLRIGVSTVVMCQNLDELPKLAQQVCDLGLDWLKLEECYPVNRFAAQSLLRPDSRRVQAAVAAVKAIVDPNGVVLIEHLHPPSGCPCQENTNPGLSEFRATDDFANRAQFRPCRMAWEVACVDPDGVVHAGDYAEPALGSLAVQSFVELWNGPRAVAQRRDALGQIDSQLRQACPH